MEFLIFDLRKLKASFWLAYAFNIAILIIGLVLPRLVNLVAYKKWATGVNAWITIGILYLISLLLNRHSKKHLQEIREINTFDGQVIEYGLYFKKRLWMNVLSVTITAIFYVLTSNQFMLLFLILQCLFFLFLYPSKRVISKELNKEDINFM